MANTNFNVSGTKAVVTAVLNSSELSAPTKAYLKGLVGNFPDDHQFSVSCTLNDNANSVSLSMTVIANPSLVVTITPNMSVPIPP